MSPPVPRRRRRRRLFLAVPLFLVGYGLYLFHWRHTLPSAPPHPRSPAVLSAVPKLSVCWIETGKILADTGSGLLVRHPRGDVLIDAGNSSAFSAELAGYPLLDRLWMKALPGALGPTTALPTALQAAGVDPAKLRWFLPTHAHIDHVGGLMDLPSSTEVLLAQPEIDWVLAPHEPRGVGVVPAHAARLRGHMTPIVFRHAPYERFDDSADLFDDGSVVVVPLYGHTPGAIGVFVTLSPGRRIFHVGDAAHDWRGLERGLSEAPILARSNDDPARADAVLASLTALHREAPELLFLPAHARAAWVKIFGDHPGSCVDR